MKTHLVDGHSVEMSDAAIVAVSALQSRADKITTDHSKAVSDLAAAKTEHAAALAAKDAELADAKKANDTKDGEIAVLKKQVADAALTPQKLDAAVAARAAVVGSAKALLGDAYKADGKTEDEIRRDAVSAKIGDAAAKGMNDDAVRGAFQALTADTKPNDPLRGVLSEGVVSLGDAKSAADSAHTKRQEALRNAWKGSTAGAA